MLTQNKQQTEKLAVTAILAALVIVLQVISTYFPMPGGVSFTLALTPIILGAVLYGPWVGAFLGMVLGGVVVFAAATQADPGGYIMFQRLPVLTVALCLVKSTAAGLAAGLIFLPFKKRGNFFPGVLLASAACPIVNTSLFCAAFLAFYRTEAETWMQGSGYSNIFAYTILSVAGLNFLIEFVINMHLAPGIERIIYAIRRRY